MGIARKKAVIKSKIIEKHGCSGTVCPRCTNTHRLIDKMEESNIPAGYWLLNMKEFHGAPKLKEIVDKYIDTVHHQYDGGNSVCFAGSQGTGKTLSAICILKAALKSGFSAYYITASDILNDMTDFTRSYDLRRKLRDSDFLVIDELDSRFFVSDSTKNLFSGIYENIFRFRSHNGFPTIMCTNETGGILDVFHGPGVQSIASLNRQYLTIYPVVGQDFRKKSKE
jgi:DNA replication protein DnaC